MESLIRYAVLFSASLLVLYIFYLLRIKKSNSFQTIRFFILSILLFSLILPLQQHKLNVFANTQGLKVETPLKDIEINHQLSNDQTSVSQQDATNSFTLNNIDFLKIFTIIYVLISLLILFRLLWHILAVIRLLVVSEYTEYKNVRFYLSVKVNAPFTFFNWIFVPEDLTSRNDLKNILEHERIHADQYHTLDIIIIEILKAVFWINPVIWLLGQEIKQNHEYLADKGVLDTGIDRLRYQTLLLNQIAEEKFLTLSSGFNHSLIKKRIVMMTKNKFNQKLGLRVLSTLPVLAIIFLGISCVNGQSEEKSPKPMAAVAPTKMNVFYVGVDNPVAIAVSDYSIDEIEVGVSNGSIKGENGKYLVNPRRPGNSHVYVIAKGDTIGKYEFRVKLVPDPFAMIGNKTSGNVSVDYLLKHEGIEVVLKNFDFDLSFEVVSFVMKSPNAGTKAIRYAEGSSGKFSTEQKEIIKNLESGQLLIIEDIKVKGPDGAIRRLGPMVFTIEE